MSEPPRTVAVLLDIENIVHAIHKKGYKKLNKRKIRETAMAIVEHIEDIARQYGQVKYKFTALAMPHSSKGPLKNLHVSQKTRDKYIMERKRMNELAFVLAELGFDTTTCQQTHDAADNVLRRINKWLIEETDTDVVVLCTEDGEDPFQRIVKENLASKNRVHIVGVDRIILTTLFPSIPVSLIGGDVRHNAEIQKRDDSTKQAEYLAGTAHVNHTKNGSAAETTKTVTEESELVIQPSPETKYDYKHLYGGVIHELKRHGQSKLRKSESSKLSRVVEIIEKKCRSEQSVSEITTVLAQELSEHNGGMSTEELQGIVYALIDFTDCFALQKKYTPNQNSEFILISRHASV